MSDVSTEQTGGRNQTNNPAWTEERVEQLKIEWAAGLSASGIAAKLGGGITRSAVIGKVHRLKLPARKRPGSGQSTNSLVPPRIRRIRRAKKTIPRERLKDGSLAPVKAEPVVEVENAKPVDISSLTEFTCRYPIWQDGEPPGFFCGAKPQPGSVYCAVHHRICNRLLIRS